MVYKNFRLRSITRDLLIVVSTFLFFYLFFNFSRYEILVVIGIFILYLVISHVRYIEKTNRDLNRFFQSIRYSDFSQTFVKEGRGKLFDELSDGFNEVMDRFRKTRAEKEESFRFLQTVVQHVGIALVAYTQYGDVVLINTPAKRLFRVAQLKNIKSLANFSSSLVDIMLRLKSGKRKLVKVEDDNDVLQLAVYATEFIMHEQKIMLVSIQDIKTELEEKEMEAWQNLIRVLTHEIMNSISPIVSYTSSINDLIENTCSQDMDKNELMESYRDIQKAITTISRRGQGLMHFVDNYRNLTNIPKPDYRIFPVAELFDRVMQLMQKELEKKNIECRSEVVPESIELTADPELIEQVLINLVVNAIQAVENKKDSMIELYAELDSRSNVLIKVTDNGIGIVENVLDKMYIPFFTTKKEGSGIGLSLSRQIMRMHGGTISAFSRLNEITVITLKF